MNVLEKIGLTEKPIIKEPEHDPMHGLYASIAEFLKPKRRIVIGGCPESECLFILGKEG